MLLWCELIAEDNCHGNQSSCRRGWPAAAPMQVEPYPVWLRLLLHHESDSHVEVPLPGLQTHRYINKSINQSINK